MLRNPVIALVLLLSAVCASADPYKGDSPREFAALVDSLNLGWPTPVALDYFEPVAGKGRIRYAHWVPEAGTAAVGTVVHFNGRTEFIERNVDTYRELLQRGYEVWTLDWRGQGLSHRNLANKFKHDIKSFDDYLIDANYFIDQVVKLPEQPGKKILLAHSMGGQIALRYLLQERASLFDFAVLSSPMAGIAGDSTLIRGLNGFLGFFWGGACVVTKSPQWSGDFAPGKACELVRAGGSPRDGDLVDADKTRLYSNDFRRVAVSNCLIESSMDANGKDQPDLRLACPTSNWLSAAFRSVDYSLKHAGRLTTPTLIVRAKPDTAVAPDAQDMFCEAAAKCSLVTVPVIGQRQPGHELLIETDAIRAFFLEQFDRFTGTPVAAVAE